MEGSSAFMLILRANALGAWRRWVALKDQSWMLLGLVFVFLCGYVLLAFSMFQFGLRFLQRFPGLGGLLVERLLFLLFAFLFGLLLLSNLVISYTNLFRNRETAFLLTAPVSAGTVFQWKLVESTLLASWAFLFLIAPLLAAYGLVNGVAWHFYPAVVVLVGLFIILPGAAGAGLAILLARFLDRRAFQIVLISALLIGLGFLAFRFRPEVVTDEELETRVLAVIDRLLDRTRFSQFPFLPSYWLSSSVQLWAEGAIRAAGFFVLVLLSHSLFFGMLVATRLGNAFYDASSQVQSRGSLLSRWEWFQRWEQRRRRVNPDGFHFRSRGVLDALLAVGGWIPSDVQALVSKDLRVFWRDTTQWGQTLMLFGLLAVYLVNIRHFTRQLDSPFWISVVGYLNLGACALNLATLTTRFVFPQFSLEGRRVWVVGLAPLGLVRVVWLKFWCATMGTMGVTVGLTLVSCTMLQLGPARTFFFCVAIAVMTLVLNSLAVGLGSLYPDFKETNPSKIVSGFGGTLCLVISFAYIAGSVGLLAAGTPWGWGSSGTDEFDAGRAAFVWTLFLLISVLAGWLPLRLGLRRVESVEL
jgi:ABC-2 type transport system permease protein